MPFNVLQSAFDGLYPAGLQWYWRSDIFREISDDAIEIHWTEPMPIDEVVTDYIVASPRDGVVSR